MRARHEFAAIVVREIVSIVSELKSAAEKLVYQLNSVTKGGLVTFEKGCGGCDCTSCQMFKAMMSLDQGQLSRFA